MMSASSARSARARSSDGVSPRHISTTPVVAVSTKVALFHQSLSAPGTRDAETAKAKAIATEKVAATR